MPLFALLDSSILVFTKLMKYLSTLFPSSSPSLFMLHHGLLLLWVLPWSPLTIWTEAAPPTSAFAFLASGNLGLVCSWNLLKALGPCSNPPSDSSLQNADILIEALQLQEVLNVSFILEFPTGLRALP